uniref:Uncharacterized protein n=1 Tax=Homalodisca liturata TaxID=320908 RepID=A0A1B6JG75_9HEMI
MREYNDIIFLVLRERFDKSVTLNFLRSYFKCNSAAVNCNLSVDNLLILSKLHCAVGVDNRSNQTTKIKFHVLIKHYFLREKSITETKVILDKYYGDSVPSISMVKSGLQSSVVVKPALVIPNVQTT